MKNSLRKYAMLTAALLTMQTFGSALALESEDFSDVPLNHANYNAIMDLRETGIVSGYEDNSFKPDNNINRVEALKLVFEVSKMDAVTGIAPADFSDIQDMAWYTPYLNLAVYREIIQGYPDGTFKPEQNVNRVEFLKMLLLAQKVDLSKTRLAQIPFADVMPGQWYSKYVDFAKIHSLVDADENKMFFPAEYITRAEAAEIIYRFKNIDWTVVPTENEETDTTTEEVSGADTDYAIYVSDAYQFAVKYPKFWFYAGAAASVEGVIREYKFGPDDLATAAARVKLNLLPLATVVEENSVTENGLKFGRTSVDGVTTITRKIADNRVYQLLGADADAEVMLYMMASITTNVAGLETYNPEEAQSTTESTGTTSTSTSTTNPATSTTQTTESTSTSSPALTESTQSTADDELPPPTI